jgi:hypothetical protein
MNNVFFRRWLAGFWLILAVLAGLVWTMRIEAMIRQGPYYQTTGFEEISIFNISRMRQGDPVYVACFDYPYRASLFNWLFYRLYGTVAVLLGPSEADLPAVLRSVTLAWTVVGMVALWFLLNSGRTDRNQPLDRWAGAGLITATWLGPMIGWWSLTVRPDVPAVVCALVGLVLVLRGGERLSLGRALAAGVLFFLAWSFKQTSVGILAGTLLALMIQRDWRGLVVSAGTVAVGVAVVLLLADRAYYVNLLEAPALAPLEFRQLGVILFWFLITWGPLLLVGPIVWLALPAAERRTVMRSRPIFRLTVVLGVTLVLNLAAARRPGSSCNYFFETWLVGMGLTGLILREAANLQEPFASPRHRLLVVGGTGHILAFAGLCLLPLFQPLDKEEGSPLDFMVRLPRAPFTAELLEAVQTSPRPIFCDDSFLVRQALGSESGDVPVIDHTVYWDARRAGKLSRPDVVERIKAREYANLWLYARNSEWEQFVRQAGYIPANENGVFRQWSRMKDER